MTVLDAGNGYIFSLGLDEPVIADQADLADWLEMAAAHLRVTAARVRGEDAPDSSGRPGFDLEIFVPQMMQIYYHYNRLILGHTVTWGQWHYNHCTGGYLPRDSAHILSLADAAVELGMHQDSLRRAIHLGKLSAVKIGRNWSVTRNDLDRYRSEHRRQPNPQQ